MLDFRTGQIFGLLLRTAPFLLLRIAVYVGITIAYVLAVGIGGGLGALIELPAIEWIENPRASSSWITPICA